jgi:solute carrier family 25 citrate transporter 1
MAAQPKAKKGPVVSFLSGGVAGAMEICVTMPLDTVKTQMQLQPGKGAVGTTKAILSSRGPAGLYFGLSAMLTQVSCKAAIRFAAVEQFRTLLRGYNPNMKSSQVNFMAGFGAGIVEAAVWVTPTERLKVLAQKEVHSANPRYSSLIGGVRVVLQEQGPRGLFVGLGPTAVRQGSAQAVRFALYDEVKSVIVPEGQKATAVQSLVAGMATGTISSLLNQPIDMAKSRMQAQDKGSPPKYSSTINCLTTCWREEGFGSWYRGAGPRVMRLTIGQGIIFSAQEHISNALQGIFGSL